MLTVGDKLPRSRSRPSPASTSARSSPTSSQAQLSRQVAGPLRLADGLHLRLPDGDRRVRPAQHDFAERGAQVLGFSTDTHYVHLAWRQHHPT